MKRRQILLVGVLLMIPRTLLGSSFPKRNVSGKVVEVSKRHGIVVLSDYKGWDREQMTQARQGIESSTLHWLDGVDPKHAAIYIDAKDIERIRKGLDIKIVAYGYSIVGKGGGSGKWDVIPVYEKLEIMGGVRKQ